MVQGASCQAGWSLPDRVKTSDDKTIEYVAFIADQLEPAAYQAGDSGCLMTSIPGQDLYLDVYDLVSGLRVINGTQLVLHHLTSVASPAANRAEGRRHTACGGTRVTGNNVGLLYILEVLNTV